MIKNKISQQIWEDRYRKNNESFEDNLKRVAKYISNNDEEFENFYNVMNEGLFYPAGRTMSNAGIGKSLTLNNCFTLNLVPDNMEGIYEYVKYGAITQKAGGGTGYNFSLLRPNGTPTSNDAVASGVVSFINAFDAQTHTVLQGSRRGANMGCLLIYHPDILEFLESKSWDEGKLTHFNLSVLVDDNFMKAKDNNKTITLHYPCMDERGKLIKDKSKWQITKEINATELWDKIMQKAYDTGEYGVLYYDNMNNDNNLNYMETIVTTNPCAEYLAGVLYNEDEVLYDHFGACNLGSVFLHNFIINPFESKAHVDWDKLNKVIRIGVRMLDNIIDINKFPLDNYEKYQKAVRTIGLGITGLADMLVMLNIKYGSKESIDFVDKLMNFISFNAYDYSCELAKEKGSFPMLNKEKFIESNFINKHIEKDKNWELIKNKILNNGIRNARMISIAPTGTLSLSYGNNCSSGLEPIFSLEYERKIKVGGQDESNTQIYPMRDYSYDLWLNKKENNIVNKDMFVTAMDLDVDAHVDILGTIAYHTDMSCSKTINIPTEYPFEKTKEVYDKCHKLGIKGCTIFRPNPIRQGILITKEKENKNNNDEKEIEEVIELRRGEWKSLAEDTYYVKRNITTGCGRMKLFIGFSPSENTIQDIYVVKTSSGGCEKNIQTIAITMSAIFRLGGNINQIEKALSGVGACPSFVSSRAKGNELSKGNYCGMAILNEIKAFLKEIDKKNNDSIESTNNKALKKVALDVLSKMNESYGCSGDCSTCKYKCSKQKETFTDEEKEFLKEYGESSFAMRYNKCPICGEKIEHTGGCITCMQGCGWSKCN